MVHRPADARLLSNLVSHEKDYSKALNGLLNISQASQSSLSAYASASPPATSRTILNVAAIFAAADDAHARYARAVGEWRDMLKGLQALEEEVGNIIRDREILITRLIKASKSSKTADRSSSHLRSPSASSLNLRESSSSYFASLIPGSFVSASPSQPQPRSLAPTSTKLAAAQSELQACETHLASKERELEVRRVQVIRDGLIIRSRALAETGRDWTQLGQEAIQAVDSELGYQDDHDVTNTASVSGIDTPPGGYPATISDSGSHGRAGEIRLPAAHAISSEIDMPIPVMTNSPASRNAMLGAALSPRNSLSGVPPPLPSRGPSSRAQGDPTTPRQSRTADTATPRHQHQPHVLPHGRVSWVSATDTEDDWVDAKEGGDELDDVFAAGSTSNVAEDPNGQSKRGVPIVTVPASTSNPTTSQLNPLSRPFVPSFSRTGSSASFHALPSPQKDLPNVPPPLSMMAPISAPGSIFDSEEYRTSMMEVMERSQSGKSESGGVPSLHESARDPASGTVAAPAPIPSTPKSKAKTDVMSYAAAVVMGATPPASQNNSPAKTTPSSQPPPPVGSMTVNEKTPHGDGRVPSPTTSGTTTETRTVKPHGVKHSASTVSLHDASSGADAHSVNIVDNTYEYTDPISNPVDENGDKSSQRSGASLHGATSEVVFVGTARKHRVEDDVRGVEVAPASLVTPAEVQASPTVGDFVQGKQEGGAAARDLGSGSLSLQPPFLWKQPSVEAHSQHEHTHDLGQEAKVKEVDALQTDEESKNEAGRMGEFLTAVEHDDQHHRLHLDHIAPVVGIPPPVNLPPSFSTSSTLGALGYQDRAPSGLQAAHVTSASESQEYSGHAHVLERRITEESVNKVSPGVGSPPVSTAVVSGQGTAEGEVDGDRRGSRFMEEMVSVEGPRASHDVDSTKAIMEKDNTSSIVDEEGNRWKAVDNPRYAGVAGSAIDGSGVGPDVAVETRPVGVPATGTSTGGGLMRKGSKRDSKGHGGISSIKNALLSSIDGPIVEGSSAQAAAQGHPHAVSAVREPAVRPAAPAQAAPAPSGPTATPTATQPTTQPQLPPSKPSVFRRMFGRGRSASVVAKEKDVKPTQDVPPPLPVATQGHPKPLEESTAVATHRAGVEAAISPAPQAPAEGKVVAGTAAHPHAAPTPDVTAAPQQDAFEAAPPAAPFMGRGRRSRTPPPPAPIFPPPTRSQASAPSSPTKLVKPRDRDRTASTDEGAVPTQRKPAPTHSHSGFLGGLRGFFSADLVDDEGNPKPKKEKKSKKGGGSTSGVSEGGGTAVIDGLPHSQTEPTQVTATETVWNTGLGEGEAQRDVVPAPATSASVGPHEGSKHQHQRSASRGGGGSTLRVLFGLPLAGQSPAEKSSRGAGGEGEARGEEQVLQVVKNDLDLEKRREKLLEQHHLLASGGGGSAHEGAPARRTSKLERHHVTDHRPPPTQPRRMDLAQHIEPPRAGWEPETQHTTPSFPDVHAPGRLNVEELQAQARATGTAAASDPGRFQQHHRSTSSPYLPATYGEPKGWSTRTDKNLQQLSWREDDDLVAGREKLRALAGGGMTKREMQFEPVILDDHLNRHEFAGLRGAEGVRRHGHGHGHGHGYGQHRQSASVVDLGYERDLERRASTASGAKLRKEKRSSSVGVHERRSFPASQSQQIPVHHQAAGYGEGGGATGVGRMSSSVSNPNVVKPRRSTSLITAPPAITALQQNQYGVTVLQAGGENPSGTIARGGWGASGGGGGANLSRNTSMMSAASTTAGGRRAQGSLGQGMGGPRTRRISDADPTVSSSMVDLSRVSATGGGASTKAARRTSMPLAMPGVPGVVSGGMPSIPKAPPPISLQALQSSSSPMMAMPDRGDASLVSIVDDIARGNKMAQEQMRALKSGDGGSLGRMDMHVVSAPGRVHRDMLVPPVSEVKSTSTRAFLASSSSGGSVAPGVGGLGRNMSTASASRPARSPFKSALRNPTPSGSRSASPMGVGAGQGRAANAHASGSGLGREVATGEEMGDDEDDDEAYETPGDGISGDENAARMRAANGGAPPPVGKSTVNPGMSNGEAVSRSAPATSGSETTPQRRKSVRVSLQPSFSPAPPPVDDTPSRYRGRPVVQDTPTRRTSKFLAGSNGAPAGRAKKTTAGGVRDMWQDSDEEENEYTRAKAMLSRAKHEEREVYETARSAAAAPTPR